MPCRIHSSPSSLLEDLGSPACTEPSRASRGWRWGTRGSSVQREGEGSIPTQAQGTQGSGRPARSWVVSDSRRGYLQSNSKGLAHCRNSIFRITSAHCTLTTKVSAASAPHLQQYCIYAVGVPTPIYIRCEGETLSTHQITSRCKSTQHTAGGEVLTAYLPFACRSTLRGVS